ncbi:MAG: four helix bundle protein [Bacteroidetes bacterium GWF2_33_38]|nr:MAG: four helix bundle protein [Bacteroidetes bacterium GWF2_33_38]HBX51673.1 four helix bundle protein [Bacteroidales bacterium]
MNQSELKNRTKKFAIEVFKLCNELESQSNYKSYLNQLIRCSSSVGANYRAACRAKSTPDFINKLKIVEEEIDESAFFLELINELTNIEKSKELLKEANEITAIIVSSIKTVKSKQANLNRKSKI